MNKKYLPFFDQAKKLGIIESEITFQKSRATSIDIFHSEVSSFSISDSQDLGARGVLNNHFGAAHTEKVDKANIINLADQIAVNASLNENDDPAIIFKGSKKYRKKNIYNPEVDSVSVDDKIKLLLDIEKRLKSADKRVSEVSSVSYEETYSEFVLMNSYGLDLSSKSNYFYIYAEVVVKSGDEVKTGYKIFLNNSFKDFNIDQFVNDVVNDATRKLGGKPIPSGKYKTVINPKVTSSLLSFYMRSAVAENIQKHTSLFEGKLGEQIASKKVTINEEPLKNNIFYTYFDAEGVATSNKSFVEKGVLKTYAYNLSTAAKDNVETTGNAGGGGSKIGTTYVNLVLKPGRLSEQELFEKTQNGFYLTEVQGLHAGLNPTSGNFSLQASGFVIRDGKMAEPVSLITVAGNLLDIFKDVVAVGNNLELQTSSTSAPSILIKKLAVAG